ncbi:MAG: universal stress protein [Thermodesulfobacteriota bacterium]
MPTKKIVLCTDFSENSIPAQERAIEYAKIFDAELVILHVVGMFLPNGPGWQGGVPLDLAGVEAHIREACKARLDAMADRIRVETPRVTAVARPGVPPAREVVRFAEEQDADLIIMGTHGWTGFKHLILGSTAENVVRTAKCPVLTVRSTVQETSDVD